MSIDLKVVDDLVYHTLELHFSDDVPVWELLDQLSTYFEDNDYDTAVIYSMTTECDPCNDSGLLLIAIWSE